jgi:hypothetical protein
MLKKVLLTGSLALLAAMVGRPASADAQFLEPYGDIYSGRVFLGATQGSPAAAESDGGGEAAGNTLIVSPFFRREDGGFPYNAFGASLGYATDMHGKPWLLWADLFNLNGPGDSEFAFSLGTKLGIWSSGSGGTSVSLFGRFRDAIDLFKRWDAGLAADQRITDDIFLTGNVGFAHGDPGDSSAIIPALGITFAGGDRWSLNGDYVFKNAVDGEDFWSLGLLYDINGRSGLRLGGGKHSTFFANYYLRWAK